MGVEEAGPALAAQVGDRLAWPDRKRGALEKGGQGSERIATCLSSTNALFYLAKLAKRLAAVTIELAVAIPAPEREGDCQQDKSGEHRPGPGLRQHRDGRWQGDIGKAAERGSEAGIDRWRGPFHRYRLR